MTLVDSSSAGPSEFDGGITFQFVPHHLVSEFELAGWRVVDDLGDCHHGQHSKLMQAPTDFKKIMAYANMRHGPDRAPPTS